MNCRIGLILAGGRSTRFGPSDKALAEVAGIPLIRRVADSLSPVVSKIVINCRAEQEPEIHGVVHDIAEPIYFAIDPDPDKGPLAGMVTGGSSVDPSGYVAIVACDMPFLDPDILADLFERADGKEAVVPSVDGWLQPTHAVYRVGALVQRGQEALEAGERRPAAMIDRLNDVEFVTIEELPEESSLSFRNINTREELQAAERLL